MSIFYLYALFLNPPSTSYFISLCVSVETNTLIRKYTLIFFPHYLYLTTIHHFPYILICSNILLSLNRIVLRLLPCFLSFSNTVHMEVYYLLAVSWWLDGQTQGLQLQEELVSSKQDQAFHKVWHTTTANFVLAYRHRAVHRQKCDQYQTDGRLPFSAVLVS